MGLIYNWMSLLSFEYNLVILNIHVLHIMYIGHVFYNNVYALITTQKIRDFSFHFFILISTNKGHYSSSMKAWRYLHT